MSADGTLTQALIGHAPAARAGAVVSVDLFYDDGDGRRPETDGALAIEMEAAALFAVGASAKVPVACVLTVSDTFDAGGERTRIEDQALLEAAERMGAAAIAALSE
jgi:nucleoside phosphorylase